MSTASVGGALARLERAGLVTVATSPRPFRYAVTG